jgi:rabenosyn-5
MLPLKSLPKMLKHASPHGGPSSTSKLPPKPNGTTALSAIRFNDLLDSSSQISSSARSSAIESLEQEEKELQERLVVLEEQKFMVSEMLNDARKKRRFDEVVALSGNVDDLTKEIDNLNGQLSGLNVEFEGVYAADGGLESSGT